MAKLKTIKTHPALTPERMARIAAARKKLNAEKAEIAAEGRAVFARHELMREIIAKIKKARLARKLTLQAVGELSRIGKANVSRLENEENPNPTFDLLVRYANAVNVRLRVGIEKMTSR